MEKKYIFLDVDGVLNNEASSKTSKSIYNLSKENVIRLKDLLTTIGVKYTPIVVVSSSWRYSPKALYRLRTYLKNYNLGFEDVLSTEKMNCRGDEIEAYCKNKGIDIDNIIILDDDSDMGNLVHRLVKTYVRDGLTYKEVEQCLILLGLKEYVWKPERYKR